MSFVREREKASSEIETTPECGYLEGTEEYETWIKQVKDLDASNKLFMAILSHCNRALIYTDEISSKKAYDFLNQFVEIKSLQTNEKLLLLHVQKHVKQDILDKFQPSKLPAESKKLIKLLEILENFKEPGIADDFRILIFVKTRESAQQMVNYLSTNSKINSFIKAKQFIGHNSDENSPGMSSSAQRITVQDFKKGNCNLLVATSVAEEGLDIGACNVVIRYDSVQHTLSLIQTRGRARRGDSFFHFVYHTSTKEKERYERIRQQEKKMHTSINLLNDIIKMIGHNPYSNYAPETPITLTPLWPYLWEYTETHPILNIDKKLQDIITDEPKMVFNLTIKRFF